MKFLFLFLFLFLSITIKSQKTEDFIKEIIEKSNNYQSIKELKLFLDKKGYNSSKIFLSIPNILPIIPSEEYKISSKYGNRTDPFTHKTKKHFGIDFSCSIGTTVHATADGKIIAATFKNTGYGRSIKVKHNYGFETLYAHLSIILIKKIGQQVNKGEIIGMVGNTGKSTGYHLHYEIIKNNKHINPYPFCLLPF